MKEIRYDGPGHILKVDGLTIRRGETERLPDDVAEELLTNPHIHVSIPYAPPPMPVYPWPVVEGHTTDGEPAAEGEGHPDTHPKED